MRDEEPVTESRADANEDLDLLSTTELAERMNREDATVAAAVSRAVAAVAAVVDEIAPRLERGGRLVYVGAGSSGRLAELDASECEATFAMPSGRVVAIVAGDDAAEDDAEAGGRAIAELHVGGDDAVVAVSASGETPFVLDAARAASAAGAFTACVVCNESTGLAAVCDREIAVVVGPEILAGSTRLKAGTAQKLVLNMLSTISMVRLGKTYAGLMIDVLPRNEKLRLRVRRIVGAATGAPPESVDDALRASGDEPKVAIVSLVAGVDARTARDRLAASGGNLRHALSE
jgi:N-acetylmuramic acid 6-phosphate etherase